MYYVYVPSDQKVYYTFYYQTYISFKHGLFVRRVHDEIVRYTQAQMKGYLAGLGVSSVEYVDLDR